MTKDKERDDALIDEVLNNLGLRRTARRSSIVREAIALERLRGDEPAKPDRYQQAWDEAQGAYGQCDCDRRENCPHAVAVLRRHFAPPSEVVEDARFVKKIMGLTNCAESLLADFILKGDQ